MNAPNRTTQRVGVVVACVLAPLAEAVLQAVGPGVSEPWRWGVEVTLWLVLMGGLTRGTGWRGSAAWPAALLVASAGLRSLPGSGVPFLAGELPQPLGMVGLGVATVALVRVIEDGLDHLPRLVRPLAVAGVTLLGVLAARLVTLVSAGVDPSQLGVEVSAVPALVAAPGERGQGPQVVLLTVDTLRWDDAQRMRSVARLAARGGYWPRAMSTASWTVPALASLHTGLLPRDHHASVRPGPRPTAIDSAVTTLAERLHARGFRTAAFLTNTFTSAALGFARGFDVQYHPDEDIPAPLTFVGAGAVPDPVERASRWITETPAQRTFLWVHLDDPHLPYTLLPADPDNALNRALDGRPDLLKVSAIRSGMLKLDGPARAELRGVYRAQVEAADVKLMRLLDAVDAAWPSAIVVLTADHGEEFFEHGNFEHGHTHHGEVLDVGLVVVGPGMGPAQRTDTASLVDVVPTILAMVDGADTFVGAGVDLRAPISPDRIVTADGNLYYGPGISARQGTRRAIVGSGEYDLAVDPAELNPLPAGPLTDAARAESGGGLGAAVDVRVEGLKALGYVE